MPIHAFDWGPSVMAFVSNSLSHDFVIKLLPWFWWLLNSCNYDAIVVRLICLGFIFIPSTCDYTFKTITMLQSTIISIIFFLAYSIHSYGYYKKNKICCEVSCFSEPRLFRAVIVRAFCHWLMLLSCLFWSVGRSSLLFDPHWTIVKCMDSICLILVIFINWLSYAWVLSSIVGLIWFTILILTKLLPWMYEFSLSLRG